MMMMMVQGHGVCKFVNAEPRSWICVRVALLMSVRPQPESVVIALVLPGCMNMVRAMCRRPRGRADASQRAQTAADCGRCC